MLQHGDARRSRPAPLGFAWSNWIHMFPSSGNRFPPPSLLARKLLGSFHCAEWGRRWDGARSPCVGWGLRENGAAALCAPWGDGDGTAPPAAPSPMLPRYQQHSEHPLGPTGPWCPGGEAAHGIKLHRAQQTPPQSHSVPLHPTAPQFVPVQGWHTVFCSHQLQQGLRKVPKEAQPESPTHVTQSPSLLPSPATARVPPSPSTQCISALCIMEKSWKTKPWRVSNPGKRKN